MIRRLRPRFVLQAGTTLPAWPRYEAIRESSSGKLIILRIGVRIDVLKTG